MNKTPQNSAASEERPELFRHMSRRISDLLGSAGAFWAAVAVIAAWGATGPLFGFSDTWQLVINTGTTIITFLMVFIIQNTQNRDNKSIHLKLDELIKAMKGARNSMIDLDRLSDEQLKALENEYKRLCEKQGSPERQMPRAN
jgi:low affinity Fe/Cu permease